MKQRYHSIHARGEKVEDVLKKAEKVENEGLVNLVSIKPRSWPLIQFCSGEELDYEEGAVEDEVVDTPTKDTFVKEAAGPATSHRADQQVCIPFPLNCNIRTGDTLTSRNPS